MESTDLWKTLPITILRPVRQRTGFRLRSSEVSVRGFHFSGMREFEAGDSFRSLSRKHFIRSGDTFAVEHNPEKNALILILLDVSASMSVGRARSKARAALDFLNLFGSACLWKGNVLQVLAFSDRIEMESDVVASPGAFDRFLDELERHVRISPRTNPHEAAGLAMDISERAGCPADMVCIVSDFLFPSQGGEAHRDLHRLQGLTDVTAVIIRDPLEKTPLLMGGGLRMRDAETGRYFRAAATVADDPAGELERQGVDACELSTAQNDSEWFDLLADFFTLRRECRE